MNGNCKGAPRTSAKLESRLPRRDATPCVIIDESVGEHARRFRALTRISDDKLRSIPQQLADCAAYVDALDAEAALDGLYNVGEHSGFSMVSSDVYQRLLADAKAKKFHALVIRDSSRLGRDYWEKLGTLRDLRQAGIEFHVVEEGGRFDFEDSLSKVQSFASSWADEQKKREEVRKSVRATQALRDMGLPTVRPPLGYQSRRDPALARRVWRPDVDADKVRALFAAIVDNPTQNRSALGRAHGLQPYQVERTLRNRSYTGGFTWRGVFTPCDPQVVPPLVDADVFERVQQLLDSKPTP